MPGQPSPFYSHTETENQNAHVGCIIVPEERDSCGVSEDPVAYPFNIMSTELSVQITWRQTVLSMFSTKEQDKWLKKMSCLTHRTGHQKHIHGHWSIPFG